MQSFSLQTELRSADREVLRELPNLVHLGDDLGDFTDTAAIVSVLDVVISVDWRASIPKSNELRRTAPNLDADAKNARLAPGAHDEINR